MKKQRSNEGGVRAITAEVATNIEWNQPRGRRSLSSDSDPVVRVACGLIERGQTVIIEEVVGGTINANLRVNMIRARMGSIRIQSTRLTDIQAEGLRQKPDSKLIPRFAVRLLPEEK
jgi:hypothetical protein